MIQLFITRCALISTLLLCLFGANKAYGGYISIYVNPVTYEIEVTSLDTLTERQRGIDVEIMHYDYYNNPVYRYFTYGLFTGVYVFEKDGNNSTLVQTLACNNIFYINRSTKTAYALTSGYNGTGDGTSGEIRTIADFANGDLYIGGHFTTAGGYSNTAYFSCYKLSGGWYGVSGVKTDGAVTGMRFVGYDLEISGNFNTVYGPAYSGGPHTSLSRNAVAYWVDWNEAFADCYWD
jgi:hypothetical protein